LLRNTLAEGRGVPVAASVITPLSFFWLLAVAGMIIRK